MTFNDSIGVIRVITEEDLGVDGRSIGIELKEMGLENVDWIDLAPDREKWRAV
jgi:hypothetical protein